MNYLNPTTRKSRDDCWPLRRADGRKWCEQREDSQRHATETRAK